MEYRLEHDTMGEVRVPADRYWGAQTQRSFENFRIGTEKMPPEVIRAFAVVKLAAARANAQLGVLDARRADAIETACHEILDGSLDGNFPLAVWQTGSGTQTNMNVNEVIAHRANALLGEPYSIHGKVVHGNHIGSSILGFPTANLEPPAMKRLPRFGVYVSRVLVDNVYYRGVTNIGKKPTVEGRYPVGVETYIFDLDRDIYGDTIEVQLLAFDRPEQKFASLEELKQLIQDVEKGRD